MRKLVKAVALVAIVTAVFSSRLARQDRRPACSGTILVSPAG